MHFLHAVFNHIQVYRNVHIVAGCEKCQDSFEDGCGVHDKPVHVPDNVVASRAMLTVPSLLCVKTLELLPTYDHGR